MQTIENKVACHQAAAALRGQGKPTWTYKANVQKVIDTLKDEPTNQQYVDGCKEIAQILRATIPASWTDFRSDEFDYTFNDVLEHLDNVTAADLEDPDFESPGDVMDSILDQMYNWADRRRVWLRG